MDTAAVVRGMKANKNYILRGKIYGKLGKVLGIYWHILS
jgi:hypothetical protein